MPEILIVFYAFMAGFCIAAATCVYLIEIYQTKQIIDSFQRLQGIVDILEKMREEDKNGP
jgi:hypothetical protein